MNTIDWKYTMQGCIAECVYRGKDDINYETNTHERTKEKYRVKVINPVCNHPYARKDAAILRSQIYERAEKAKEQVCARSSPGVSMAKLRRAQKAWDEIANEWRNFECPHFTAPTSHTEYRCHHDRVHDGQTHPHK